MKIAPAVPNSSWHSLHVTSGMPRLGRPLGTAPSCETPCATRSQFQLTKIAPITAMSAPGIRLSIRFAPRITMITPSDNATVATLASERCSSASKNLRSVPPDDGVMPSIVGNCPSATWTPTPVRKPINTLLDRKSARNPKRIRRARINTPPVMSASMPASSTYCGDATGASPARPAARIAAVAESAPTTRCRDELNSANTAIGNTMVYKPVTTGMPAILAYPITSGMPSAANVTPAATSNGTRLRSIGTMPSPMRSRRFFGAAGPLIRLWFLPGTRTIVTLNASATRGYSLRRDVERGQLPQRALRGRRWIASRRPETGATSGDAEAEPDVRFSYANERTFLAWIRTSLGLITAGLAITQLLPPFDVPGGRRLIGLPLIALSESSLPW